MLEDKEQARRTAQEERDQQREKLFLPVGSHVTDVEGVDSEDEGTRVVDEIESLCVNCEENVSQLRPNMVVPFAD